MVAIKDMKMPRACTEVIETLNEKGWIDASIKKCPLYNVCNFRDTIKNNFKSTNCPLVEIEPLSDEEKRIFLSAMGKERVICKQIDIDKVDDGSIKKLVPIVNTIERKIKKVLWN